MPLSQCPGAPRIFCSHSRTGGGSTVGPHYAGLRAGETEYPQHMCHKARMFKILLQSRWAMELGKRITIEFVRLQGIYHIAD